MARLGLAMAPTLVLIVLTNSVKMLWTGYLLDKCQLEKSQPALVGKEVVQDQPGGW